MPVINKNEHFSNIWNNDSRNHVSFAVLQAQRIPGPITGPIVSGIRKYRAGRV
jgi:hypothetical protein